MIVLKSVAVTMLAALALVSGAAEAAERDSDAILVPPVHTSWPGKIFVSHDEWLLGDFSLSVTPDARTVALNVAAWFTQGRPGRFLAYSTNFGLTQPMVAELMTGAGHTWTVSTTVDFDLATLLHYDAVFLAGDAADLPVLSDYVRAGGHVYLAAGTGWPNAAEEAARWNPFLEEFGLSLGSLYSTTPSPAAWPVMSSSPLLKGVTSLYAAWGNPITKLSAKDPTTRILAVHDGLGLFGTYDATVVPVAVEICPGVLDPDNRENVIVTIVGTPDVDVRKIDPASVRLVQTAARKTLVTFGTGESRGRRLGKINGSACRIGNDRQLDIVLSYDSRDLVRAASKLLGEPVEHGDTVALTLTGRLRPQFGGTPIVGEGIVLVRDRNWRARSLR